MRTSIHDKIGMFLFLVPPLLLFAAFFIFPIGFISVTSTMKWDGMSEPVFVGLQNFITLLTNSIFQRAIGNNIIWALVGGLVQVPLAMLVALLLSHRPAGWKILRTIYFFPNVISGVALAMMWSAIYNNEYGALNALLEIIGLGHLQQNWLGGLHTALPAMLIYWVFYIGYFMVIILAEISSIPETFYEAARIDGASSSQMDLYITLPLIKGSTSTCLTLAMIYGLRQFEQVFLLTNGGPANRTMTLSLFLYRQLQIFNYGFANASGVVLILVGAIVIITIKKLFTYEQYQT